MQIDIVLQDPRGDEIGVVKLEAVRLAAVGVETAPPDLSGQMTRLIARLGNILTGLGFSPVLDPLGVRIAVSHALLDAQPGGIRIPLHVLPVNGGVAAMGLPEQTPKLREQASKMSPGASSDTTKTTAGGPASDEWGHLFELCSEKAAGFEKPAPGASSSKGLSDKPVSREPFDHSREPFDQWTELGDIWAMNDEGDEL